MDPAQRAGGIIASQARSVISAAEAHAQEIREEARADARQIVAEAVADARAVRSRIEALADVASDLLRDVRRSADRLIAELGFEPEVVSGLVQLEASLGSSVAGAAESDRLTPDIPVDHAEQTPAADRDVAGHEEDDDAVSEAGVDEPVDATLVEDEAGNGSGGAKDVTAVKGNTVPCTDCQASGACSKCDGKGKRLLFRCSRCGGSGLCPTCGGPGFLWQ